jgi:LEA14-like dessication related protein
MRAAEMLTAKRLLLLASLWMAACSVIAPKFETPTLSVMSIEMTAGNILQQNFLVTVNIHNPNPRALPVTSLHAELHVAGEQIASGVSNRSVVVPPLGDAPFDMTITASMALALLKLAANKDRHADSIDYVLTGGVSIDLPFLRDMPFHQSGSFATRLPR